MDKCWFVLKQKHYPPPQNGVGPIQLGHLIPDLKHLNQVINNDPGPTPFPRAMVVYDSRLEDLEWSFGYGHDLGGSGNARVPIPQAAGLVSVGGQAGAEFKKSVSNFWHFEALDTLFIQPTATYIEDSLKGKLVQGYIEKKRNILLNTWSLFMITGLAIARAAKGSQVEERGWSVKGGPEVSFAGIVDGGLDSSFKTADGSAASFKKSSDFVWAIQLAKISRHIFSELSHETYVKGATYSTEEEDDVKTMLSKEGIDTVSIHITEDDVFVLPNVDSDGVLAENK